MFTSMDLDEELFDKAWSLSEQKTKRGMIEEALRVYLRLHEQAGVRGLRSQLLDLPKTTPTRRRRRANAR
ncbi:MAG TPA: type II toxin-antitoxin system VapB family antitoxin [Thermoanaerobaculia bacterium]|nr:type II toxin-antitoxin system VapB family antitoxin [Thermoanaerobaculia bacterium]